MTQDINSDDRFNNNWVHNGHPVDRALVGAGLLWLSHVYLTPLEAYMFYHIAWAASTDRCLLNNSLILKFSCWKIANPWIFQNFSSFLGKRFLGNFFVENFNICTNNWCGSCQGTRVPACVFQFVSVLGMWILITQATG